MQTVTHRQLFFQHIAQTSDFPLGLEIERAEGIYLYESDTRRYVDLISGIGVSNVGHRHPHVLEAIHHQLDKYMHLMVYGEYIQTPQTQLAHALAQTLPPSLNNVYFTNSGTEAVEGAMKLAKRYTGRSEIISCFNAYHGSTQGALSLSGDENFKRNFRPLLPDIRHIRHGNPADLDQITNRTAAVIIEVVAGEAGVRVPEPAYFQALRQRCSDTGALLIFDEIQTGYGRTGTFWAFEGVSVIPDILLCAKGMGGGMPIGAFISSDDLMSVFKNNPILGHITTFGGHPVSCAASLATLQVIQEQKLHEQAEAKGQLFRQLLRHPAIREIRGKGLMLAVEFDSFDVLKPIIDRAIASSKNGLGIITDWFLFCNNSMRIAPPLIITEEQIRESCGVILEAIG
ncbi:MULTISPECIES: aspartate aminotransferase family protein [unclassified Spirosoma]|uniref:aspartate aminotransferase family protein n=1 Tax=unclassified Spirosoma TaxID=2621999 RepID=UPI00096041A4|nr:MULTISPECIES: aspartate aminotransferase family protein [unclassified Spirosoma]MBN8826203.1 aspartate aminotransferase family protein [Spirosoma sp.]OJW76901.1 MAG: aspartate aminotransferase family protein [Spirosoma sp. 48-14]